ncbi:MAG: response regulator transcription factor [Nitrospira sp.]|nr:response regulator transcription factor [Nitrospira sp.]
MAQVALCDDHRLMMEGQRRVLEALGHRVVAMLGNGRELVQFFERGMSVDLVILDVSMPLLNGIDTVPRILALSRTTKCMVMSMHEDPARITAALVAGAKGYMSKVANMDDFEVGVRMVLGGQSYVSPHLCFDVVWHEGKRACGERMLSTREREVLQLIGEGLSDKEVAKELDISARTARFHRDTMRREHQCPTTAHLVKLALRHGLTEL